VLKLAPVALALRRPGSRFSPKVCLSGQHGELARRIASEIGLDADFDVPSANGPQSLSESLAGLVTRLDAVLAEAAPRGVVVQGDTTTALAAALVGFHHAVPVFHVEAGLRTSDPRLPFPEEMNRRLVTRLAAAHFAPTEHARQNLLREGVSPEDVRVTGNTIVDALHAFGRLGGGAADALLGDAGGRAHLLVTLHRRENAALAGSVASAVRELTRRSDVEVLWIRHPNATATAAVAALEGAPGVRVLDPQPYAVFVGLMQRARAVLTDSGGVQEEAPVLGVPVVVLRTETDRPEAVLAGNAVVTGADTAAIVRACTELLDDPEVHARRSRAVSPFGDGKAAERIVTALEQRYFG
jgi:UDP-N-acetylglucosamine 2-epimerase (non-hydrolysing)